MPRQTRLLPAGYPVHVVQRGVDRRACFRRDSDYLRYLQLLTEQGRETACAIHAYVLMPNHVHLLLTAAAERSVSLLLKRLGQRYAQYFNRTGNRTGPLWEGRFKSSVLADDSYLLACQCYIELNPVRAGLVNHPRAYAWSSYRTNAEGVPSALIRRHPVYISLATNDDACVGTYRALFDDALQRHSLDEIRIAVNHGKPLGRLRLGATFGRIGQNPGLTPGAKTGV